MGEDRHDLKTPSWEEAFGLPPREREPYSSSDEFFDLFCEVVRAAVVAIAAYGFFTLLMR